MNSFSRALDEVSKQSKREKTLQAENNGELQTTGCSKLYTHADNLALGNPDPPEQQADTTAIRPRDVVGPPMEAVAHPTLTPRINELPARRPGNKDPRTSRL